MPSSEHFWPRTSKDPEVGLDWPEWMDIAELLQRAVGTSEREGGDASQKAL